MCVVVWLVGHDSSPIVNDGWLWAAVLLTVVAVISITSGWRMHVDEREALVTAQQAVGFPVGHASAQQVWRGLRSRPTWRVLCYSVEDPPSGAASCSSTPSTAGSSSTWSRTTPSGGRPHRRSPTAPEATVRIAVGTDEVTAVTAAVERAPRRRRSRGRRRRPR